MQPTNQPAEQLMNEYSTINQQAEQAANKSTNQPTNH
jgi:hypothetical protein